PQHAKPGPARREEVPQMRPAHQREAKRRLRVPRGEPLRDARAERLPGQEGFLDADRREEQAQVVGVLLRRVVTVGPAARSVAALVHRVYMEARAEVTRRPLPHASVAGGGVEEDERRLRAGPFVIVSLETVRQDHVL